MADELRKVFKIIQDRKKNPKPDSYTNSLFNKGEEEILAKIDEESKEVIKAIKENEGNKRLLEEVDDLFYHVFVLMVEKGLTFEDLENEEKKRMK